MIIIRTIVIVSNLWEMKLRHREFKSLIQDHTAGRGEVMVWLCGWKAMNESKILPLQKKCYGEIERFWIKHIISKAWTKERNPTAALCCDSRKTYQNWQNFLLFRSFRWIIISSQIYLFCPHLQTRVHTDLGPLLRSQSSSNY